MQPSRAATSSDTTPGTHSFVLTGTGSYSKQWGGVTINIDNTTALPFFSGHELGPTNTISFEDGFYYSLRILDADVYPVAESNMKLAVMKTSAPPVSISRTGQTPALPTPDDPIVVSIGLSQPKSVEERVYLRWTTDSFITSHLIEAQGSGTSYSATIPAQPAGTLLLYTYITSTADLSAYSSSGVIDSQVLATTGVFNAVPPTPPQITQQPAYARVKVGRTARFQVVAVGGGPLSYQWSKNGAIIVGATNSSYTTPATTQTDNGSLFSVMVRNGNGSTTSNNALLKVR